MRLLLLTVPHRIDAPVVLTGADIPPAQGVDPERALGFRWSEADLQWVQIPIQIDERHMVGFGSAPGNNSSSGVDGTIYGNGQPGPMALQYSDPNTFVGADPDPTFDADDELAFMVRDSGERAASGTARPGGTKGAGLELEVTDGGSDAVGYVYLYRGVAGSDPSAGLDYVDYSFSLDSGDYKSTYRRAEGPNPESSTVSTASYSLGFSDRWIHDDIRVTNGTGVDILDGHKSQFAIGFCGRSNVTFADAEGAFVANIDGPVRAIRSYVGANSGPLTQRTFFFYLDRYEMKTDLRVHSIPSVVSFLDYSADATGMVYRNSEMPEPVTIDGNPDAVPSAVADWAYVTGPQGSLLSTTTIDTSASLTFENLYIDDSRPAAAECWGDGGYLGASGQNIGGGIPNTDPRIGPPATFVSNEIMMPVDPGIDPEVWAPKWHESITTGVTVESSVFR